MKNLSRRALFALVGSVPLAALIPQVVAAPTCALALTPDPRIAAATDALCGRLDALIDTIASEIP